MRTFKHRINPKLVITTPNKLNAWKMSIHEIENGSKMKNDKQSC